MDAAALEQRAQAFSQQLQQTKNALAPAEFGWYPYGTLDNFHILNRLLTGAHRHFLDEVRDGLIVDIGAADGDMAFFLESLGHRVHVVDYGPTNFNGCRGVRLLKQQLESNVEILETDIDTRMELPAPRYELAFFLGILYHLKIRIWRWKRSQKVRAMPSSARASPGSTSRRAPKAVASTGAASSWRMSGRLPRRRG